jgi:hypothetical protein
VCSQTKKVHAFYCRSSDTTELSVTSYITPYNWSNSEAAAHRMGQCERSTEQRPPARVRSRAHVRAHACGKPPVRVPRHYWLVGWLVSWGRLPAAARSFEGTPPLGRLSRLRWHRGSKRTLPLLPAPSRLAHRPSQTTPKNSTKSCVAQRVAETRRRTQTSSREGTLAAVPCEE